MGHPAGTGKRLMGTLNKATPPMATLATTLDDGAWITTGSKPTEDYRRKTVVVILMTGREGGETTANNGLYLTLVGTVGLSRTGKLFRSWKSPGSRNNRGTGNRPLAGNRAKTTVPISRTGASAINNDRETAMPTSLVTSTTITATIAGIDRVRRGKSGKTRISSEGIGSSSNNSSNSSRKTRTPTSSCFIASFRLGLNVSLNPRFFLAGRDVTRTRYQVSIRYRSSVDNSVQGRGQRHPRIHSTLGGALMEDGRGHGRHLRNVYDIASALPGTTPALLTSVRSGRRTDSVTTNRIAKEDALDEGAHLPRVLPHQGVLVLLRVEALGPGTDHGRCIGFRQRRTFVTSTLHCH